MIDLFLWMLSLTGITLLLCFNVVVVRKVIDICKPKNKEEIEFDKNLQEFRAKYPNGIDKTHL